VFGQYEKFQTDPHFQNYPWFHEYFHADNGRGLGANHQTGWTALVAKLLQPKQKPRKGSAVNGSAAHNLHAEKPIVHTTSEPVTG
jgi:hypothetical protein